MRKSVKTKTSLLLSLLLCLTLYGCQILPDVELPANVYVDSTIPKSRIFGFGVNEEINSTGLLEVEASFQNQGLSQYDFVYRFIWFDKDQRTIKTRLSNWKSLQVLVQGFATLHGIAPKESVAGYRLEVYSKATIFEINSAVSSENNQSN